MCLSTKTFKVFRQWSCGSSCLKQLCGMQCILGTVVHLRSSREINQVYSWKSGCWHSLVFWSISEESWKDSRYWYRSFRRENYEVWPAFLTIVEAQRTLFRSRTARQPCNYLRLELGQDFPNIDGSIPKGEQFLSELSLPIVLPICCPNLSCESILYLLDLLEKVNLVWTR